MSALTIGAYYYPGWHPCPVRDEAFPEGWTEWSLLDRWTPQFDGHRAPDKPRGGYYDDSDPKVMDGKVELAASYGIDQFTFAFYWCRGKRLLQGALDKGFLPVVTGSDFQFSLMWANRMPRKVLPVKDPGERVVTPERLAHTDPNDFLEFIQFIATRYFEHPNYYHFLGGIYLSILDTNFFIRQLGPELAQTAIDEARCWLATNGFDQLHLAAIDPIPEFRPLLKIIGFDSVTHYVFLPDWKGPATQDYRSCCTARAQEWPLYSQETGLPYVPSVSPGWDATPRASDYPERERLPDRYPWRPIVTDASPAAFDDILSKAAMHAHRQSPMDPMVMIASWNEWTESHGIEPGEREGDAYLARVRDLKKGTFDRTDSP